MRRCTRLVVLFSTAALTACGLDLTGYLPLDPVPADAGPGPVPDDASLSPSATSPDGVAPTTGLDAGSAGEGGGGDGGGDGGGGSGSDASAIGDAAGTCVPAPRACTVAADCTKGRCCLAAAGSVLTGTCRDDCEDGFAQACLTTGDCDKGVCGPHVCACGEIVLACRPIPGACP
jgi:hypothetical protein